MADSFCCPICGKIIDKHNMSCGRKCFIKFIKTLDYNDVRNRYINEQYSILDMSNHYHVPATWIRRILKTFNIPQRGIKESSLTDLRRKKTETTNLKKYGARHNFCKTHSSRQQWEARLLQNEGIVNVFQRKAVKEKIHRTKLERYGEDWKWQHAKVNFVEHYIQKYGEEEGRKIFKSICERKGQACSRQHYVELYGESEGLRLFNEKMAKRKSPCHWNGLNQKCAKLLDELGVRYEREFYFPSPQRSYRYDFKIGSLILELNGTYWHCDPRKYKPNDLVKFPYGHIIKASDKWEYDAQKNNWATNNGYEVEVIWESDINIELIKTILMQHNIKFYVKNS